MSMKALLQGLNRLSVTTCEGGAANFPRFAKNNHLPTVCVLQNKHFSTSSNLSRKLDSRRWPANKFPSSNGRWVEQKTIYELNEYTTEPFRFPNTGGRGPNGKIWNHKRGGGLPKSFRMVDYIRGGPTQGPPLEERVIEMVSDDIHSAHLALVARDDHKRLIVASNNMKVGDIVKSSRELTVSAVRPKEGDSHPLGSLPLGTLVYGVEAFPDQGAKIALSAGTAALIVRKMGDNVVVRMPSKREICVSNRCVATVGRASNVDHNKQVWGTAGAKRRAGFRPSSGRWHRKDGRYGRKITAIKPMVQRDAPPVKQPLLVEYYSVDK